MARRQDKLDKDTQKELNTGKDIAEFVKHPAWGQLRQQLVDKLLDLQSVLNIEGEPNKVVTEILARQMAVKTLYSWLQEIEGRAAQYESNALLVHEKQDSYIKLT